MTVETFETVWDAITDDPAEAAQLRIMSELMLRLSERIRASGWTREAAALRLAVPESTVADLMDGRIQALTIDRLVSMAIRAGLQVELRIPDAA